MSAPRWARVCALGMAVMLLAAACGDEGGAAAPEPLDDPFEEVERALPDADAPQRSAPRWEEVLTLSGDGPTVEEFPIAQEALQWRAVYRCESGELRLEVDAAEEPVLETD